MVLKPTPNRGPISSRLSLDFVLPVLPSTGRSRAGAPPTRAPAARTGPGQFWLPPSAAHLHSNGGGAPHFDRPQIFLRCPFLQAGCTWGQGSHPSPASLLSSQPPDLHRTGGGGRALPLDQAHFLCVPSTARGHFLLPVLPLVVLAPMGSEASPFHFPRSASPTLSLGRKSGGGGVEPGGVRWVGTGAASSLCPACSLCQSYRDLLGGPGASVGAIKVNLLPPGRVRVVLRLAAWGRPGLSGRASAADPGRRFSPAHREFVFVDVFICQLRGWGQGLLAQGEGPGFRAAARPHKGPSGAGNLDTVRWLLGRDRRSEGGARSRPPPRPSPLPP